MRSAIKFTWNGPLPTDDEIGADPSTRYSNDYGEQWCYQATQPVASAVREVVAATPGVTPHGEFYFGEQAWYFDAKIENREYCFAVFWAPDRDGRDAFCVQPSVRRGCIANLFAGPLPDQLVDPARDVLWSAMQKVMQVPQMRWVSQDEIGK